VTSPAELFTNRLRARLAASAGGIIRPGDDARAKYALRVDLEEFTQVFDAPERAGRWCACGLRSWGTVA